MSVYIQDGPAIFYAGQPMDRPRIGWDTIGQRGTVAASTEAAGFAAANANAPGTGAWWKPTALPATWQVTVTAETVNYWGLAAHNLGTSGATVYFETWDGLAWVTQGSATPTNDSPIMFLAVAVSTAIARVRVTGSTIPYIGVIYMGAALEMPHPFYAGHTPIDLGRRTEMSGNKTETGQWVGRSIQRVSQSTQYNFDHLAEDWVRSTFTTFTEAAKSAPFFMAERPVAPYLDAVGYVWTTGDIIPQRSGVQNLMQVSFDVEGYVNG